MTINNITIVASEASYIADKKTMSQSIRWSKSFPGVTRTVRVTPKLYAELAAEMGEYERVAAEYGNGVTADQIRDIDKSWASAKTDEMCNAILNHIEAIATRTREITSTGYEWPTPIM